MWDRKAEQHSSLVFQEVIWQQQNRVTSYQVWSIALISQAFSCNAPIILICRKTSIPKEGVCLVPNALEKDLGTEWAVSDISFHFLSDIIYILWQGIANSFDLLTNITAHGTTWKKEEMAVVLTLHLQSVQSAAYSVAQKQTTEGRRRVETVYG